MRSDESGAPTAPKFFAILTTKLFCPGARELLFHFGGWRCLWHHCHAEHRQLAHTCDVLAARFFFRRQVKSLAVLTAINLTIVAVRPAHVGAALLHHVGRVEPPFQMAATQLALLVLFVAGALEGLLVLDFMLGQLRWFVDFRHDNCGSFSASFVISQPTRTRALAAVSVTAYFTAHHTRFLRSTAPIANNAPLMRVPN